MKAVSDFLVYYGHDPSNIPRLQKTELLIYESRGWNTEDQARLTTATTCLAYLSCFAWAGWQGPCRWWWGHKERDPQWDAWWLSLASPGWKFQISREWKALKKGHDGLFFDNLDRLEQDPKSLPHFISLLKQIKGEWPEAILVGNRGFAHWPALRPYLDGVLFENFTDQAFTPQDKEWVEEQLLNLQGTKVLALDYLTRRDAEEAGRLCRAYPKIAYYAAPDESLQRLTQP